MIMQQLRILKGMVAVFVFCQCFTIVADLYELICTIGVREPEGTRCKSNMHIENLINVAHFLLSINSSINFIFYKMHPSSPELWTWGAEEELEEGTPLVESEGEYKIENYGTLFF